MYVDLQKVKTKYLSLSYVRYVASSPCLPLVSLLRYSYLRTDTWGSTMALQGSSSFGVISAYDVMVLRNT